MQSLPTVWIVNYSGHDFSAAKPWGKLKVVTEGYVSQESLDRVLYTVTRPLFESDPNDWLALSGMGILQVAAVSFMLAQHGRANLLVWDGKAESYRELKLSTERLKDLPKLVLGDDA